MDDFRALIWLTHLGRKRNGRLFADDIFKRISFNEKKIAFSFKFRKIIVRNVSTITGSDNDSALNRWLASIWANDGLP